MNELLICITSHPLDSPSLVNKLHTALQANLQGMDVDQKSPTSSQHADTTMMVSTVITFHLTFAASRLSQKEDCLLHNFQYMLHPYQTLRVQGITAMLLQDASQSSSRRTGSHSPKQQPGLSLPSLPAIPETPEGAMQRALSIGEEGRRGQCAYASFVESSGGSLNLVRSHSAADIFSVCPGSCSL